MATCKIQYIEDLAVSDPEKSRLTNLHLDISKQIYSHRINTSGYVNKLFTFVGDKLYVPKKSDGTIGSYHQEAINLVNIINRNVGFEAVRLIEDGNRLFVSVDVSPDSSVEHAIDNIDGMHAFYKNYFGDSAIITDNSEIEDAVIGHEEQFRNITDRVIEKASVYLRGLERSGDYYKQGRTEQDLRILIASLKDKSTYGVIEGLSKYILTSSSNLKKIKNRLSIIESRLSNLSTDPDIRKAQLKEISDFVRHSSYYYHLFDKLDDISTELTKLNIDPKVIDSYERDLLEADLKQWMEDLGVFSETEIVDFLNTIPNELQDSGNFFNKFKALYKDKMNGVVLTSEQVDGLENSMMDILNKNMKSDGSILQQLSNLTKTLKPFKSRLKELHYEVLTEIYYPVFSSSFDSGKMSIDGTTPLEDKWKVSKEDFKSMLAVASEDIDAISMWGSAMINVKEMIPTTIANFFKEVMIDIDLTNKKDVSEFQDFLVKNGRQQGDQTLRNLDRAIVSDNLTIEAIEIVEDDYIPDDNSGVITIKTFGVERKYRARKTRNFIAEYNTIQYNNLKKAFSYNIQDAAENYAKSLMNDKYSLTDLKNSDEPVLNKFYNLLYTTDRATGDTVISNHMGRFLSTSPSYEQIKSKVIGMLWTSFYKENLSIKSESEIRSIFETTGITKKGSFVDLNDDANVYARQYAIKNSYFVPFREFDRGSNLQDRYFFDRTSLFGIEESSSKQVLVKFDDLTYGYVEIIQTPKGSLIVNTSGKQISEYATFSRNFSNLNDRYNIKNGGFGTEGASKWAIVNSTSFGKEYYDKLINLYEEGRKNYSSEDLANMEIPQVDKLEESGKVEKIKDTLNNLKQTGGASDMFKGYTSSYLVEENKIPLRRNGVYVNEDGEEVNDPVYVSTESQYVNSQKIRYVSAKFTRPIDIKRLETDLYKSVLLYKTASNSYRGLKDNESQALLLQTVIEGDTTLGIEPRKAKVKRLGVDVKVPGGGVKMKEHDLNTSKMIVSFINDYIYGIQNEDTGILGSRISAKKVASVISGYTAYTALAWNFSTMIPNRLISLANTRVVAEGNEWFNDKHWQEAIAEYHKNLGGFLNDFKSGGFLNQKSTLTQLISRFNAIQGDFLSPNGIIESKNVGDKMIESAAFWTSEMVEHMNQTESMIMLMKGYNLPSGISLWDAIQASNKDKKEGESIIMPDEFTREIEIEFQKRLQGVNRQIHGNYQKLDKNMLQKGVFTNMLMTFKKYIYDGFRSRFQEERYDQELRDEQEGYFRTYLKALNKDFTEIAKTQGLVAALKSDGLKTVGNSLLKTTLGAWDAATFRLASKNENVSKYLYGDSITDRQHNAAMKATYDMGFVIRAMIMAIVVEALLSGLDEDDEELKFILTYADVFSRKLENDLGFFTSFTNFGTGSYAGATLDQTIKTIKNPLASVRTMDNTIGLFKQLIDFDTINENGQFELSWGALDTYDKSGNGYEKGDLKITRKLEKSIVSPYWQMIKIADPYQQQDYLNLTQKYQSN